MNSYWIATIGTSVIAFTMKYSGHSVPEKWLSHPKIQRINALIPIALLSALVAVQSTLPNCGYFRCSFICSDLQLVLDNP